MFKKGQSGNPAGKPKGTKHKINSELHTAVQLAEKRHGKSLLNHFIDTAYKEPAILKVLLDKLYPNLKHQESNIKMDENNQITVIIKDYKPTKKLEPPQSNGERL